MEFSGEERSVTYGRLNSGTTVTTSLVCDVCDYVSIKKRNWVGETLLFNLST